MSVLFETNLMYDGAEKDSGVCNIIVINMNCYDNDSKIDKN